MTLQGTDPALLNAQSLLRSRLKKLAPICFAIAHCDNKFDSPEIVEAAIAISKIFENDPDVITAITENIKESIH